jgi:hypothetical protein
MVVKTKNRPQNRAIFGLFGAFNWHLRTLRQDKKQKGRAKRSLKESFPESQRA